MSGQNMSCLDDCPYHVLAMQACTRLTLSTNIATSLRSLLSAERYLKDFKMPGWSDLNENSVKRQIDFSERARRKSTNNLKLINETIKQGCPSCRARFDALYQNLLPSQPEPQPEYHQQVDFTLQGLVPLLKPNQKET